MPTETFMMCYIHDFIEQLTQEFTVKKIMAVASLNDDNLTKIVYLRVKTFIPVDPNISCQIKDFTNGQINTTSVKLIDNMGFDNMPIISLNGMILGLTTKTVRNIDNNFYVEEKNLGDQELREFWVS
ncbi:hypothetical protein RhiirC2_794846 [Rhizophagus irregularis]|uniref:Uncharacterized protein n=1 Tax=Rhizophagus irregularis TaxID=588596 RepID=A0A2N1MCR9_9GLOM|nr:hypothetical protein RhiirC2_794846 [Rhizophagus irregularis]